MIKKIDKELLRQRAMRLTLSCLLNSDLQDDELQALADILDEDYLADLAFLLRRLGQREGAQPAPYSLPAPSSPTVRSSPHSDLADSIYQRVRLRKLGRGRVLAYMREINPSLAKKCEMSGEILVSLIRRFVSQGSLDDGELLLNRVTGKGDVDPYLDGITNKNRFR